ncbi:hypothetical protein V1508DRAFT_424841 [Lipomyces doorenjongii]|uniref:uncharacterized protein n=1 Tax=Lipomyces doorenjongii TaxID=383834 RepID=UPI0034CE704B
MMLFKSKLVALLCCAVLADNARYVSSGPTLQPNTIVESVAVQREHNVIKMSKHDYVAEMNLVSDVILCTVGLLEFLIRANILKPCWMGCGNSSKVRHFINTIDSTPRNTRPETPSYSAVLSNMSFSVRFPHEMLDVLKDPMVQQLIASNPIPALSGAMDDSWREPYVKIENTNVTLHLRNYLGLDASSSGISESIDESFAPVEIVDITPLLELLESILHDTKGVCTYLRAMNGDQVTTGVVRIPDAVYGKAEEMHRKLHVIQRQGTRIILLDDAMFNAGTLVCTARELIESLTICFTEDT